MGYSTSSAGLRIIWPVAIAVSVLLISARVLASATTGSVLVVESDSLANAIRIFSERHNVRVTYEDPILVCTGELEDVSIERYSNANIIQPVDLVPLYAIRRINFRAEYALHSVNCTDDDISAALHAIVESYNNNGDHPGRFTVRAEATYWHVYPSEIRNKNGDWVAAEPFLSRAISVHPQSTNLYRLVFSLMEPEVKSAGLTKFGFGSNPIGPVPTSRGPVVSIVGGQIDLRTLLSQIFGDNFTGMVWQLRCGPTEHPGAAPLNLNLYQLNPSENDAEGSRRPSAALQPDTSRAYGEMPRFKNNPNTSGVFRLSFNSPRPLRDAVDAFMKAHRVIATYEDPLLVYSNDLEDKTHMRKDLAKFPDGIAPKVLEPRTHFFSAEYLLDTNNITHEDLGVALTVIVRQYNTSLRTAEFGLIERPGIWHIVPKRIRDSTGRWIDHIPLLDHSIHVEDAKTNVPAFVATLLRNRAAAGGYKYWEFTTVPPQIVSITSGDYILRDLLV